MKTSNTINKDLNNQIDDYLSKNIDKFINKYFDNKVKKDKDTNMKQTLSDIKDLCYEIIRNNNFSISLDSLNIIARYFFNKGIEYSDKGKIYMSYDSAKHVLK